jgi:GTPase involved in cell partitioning and DNA repair
MKLLGSSGTDINIMAPVGVTVLTDDGQILGDLTTRGQTITVAQGWGTLGRSM